MEKHHAIFVYANSIESAVIDEVYKKQSTDIKHIVRDRFSIDDARELAHASLQTPFQSDKHVFVIAARDIAVEAQNALLKLFEEPPAHAQFILVASPTLVLLPTLRSRLSVQDGADDHSASNTTFAHFKNASFAERIAQIAEKTKEKDRVWITQILQGCEMEYAKDPIKNTQLLQAILFVRKYIETKGASTKMLLEDIALRMPLQ